MNTEMWQSVVALRISIYILCTLISVGTFVMILRPLRSVSVAGPGLLTSHNEFSMRNS